MATAGTRGRVRYAIVGAGHIAQTAVLPAFAHAKENSELVALISGDPLKREELGKRYKLERVGDYPEFEEVLTQARVDAVYVATTNTLHRELVERAARAGVHVLCEKPMATRVTDCEAMLEAAEAARIKLMVAYRLHFEEANLHAVETVRSGVLGEPKIFTSVFTQQVRAGDIRTQAATGGGALFDMGVYSINAARYLFRDEPAEVTALIPPSLDPRFSQVDETSTLILRFHRGQVAQITASLGASPLSTYRVIGSEGDLLVEPAFSYATELAHQLTVNGRVTRRTFAKRDQFGPELLYFSRCILEGIDPEPSGEEGLADVRVVEAALESARTGRSINLPYFERAQRPDLTQAISLPPVKKAPKAVHAPPTSLK